jgi:hypothetical protein
MQQILQNYELDKIKEFKYDFNDYRDFVKSVTEEIKRRGKESVDLPCECCFSFLYSIMEKPTKYLTYKVILENNQVIEEDIDELVQLLIHNLATKEEIIEVLPFIHKFYAPAYVLRIIKVYKLPYSILIDLKKNDPKITECNVKFDCNKK